MGLRTNIMASDMLILASASPRRTQLLEQIGVKPFSIRAANIDETPLKAEKPSEYAKRMAYQKAQAIARSHNEKYVLAADTVVATGRTILPKAETQDDVRKSMSHLGGRNHRVYGGICLILPGGLIRNRLVETRVFMRRLSEGELSAYCASSDWKGKAGGYAIQGNAAQYIKKISGSYSNVVGLDLYITAQLLKGAGLSLE